MSAAASFCVSLEALRALHGYVWLCEHGYKNPCGWEFGVVSCCGYCRLAVGGTVSLELTADRKQAATVRLVAKRALPAFDVRRIELLCRRLAYARALQV